MGSNYYSYIFIFGLSEKDRKELVIGALDMFSLGQKLGAFSSEEVPELIAHRPEGAEDVSTSNEFMDLYTRVIDEEVFQIHTHTYRVVFSSLWVAISNHFNVKVSVIDVNLYDQYLTINHLTLGIYSKGSDFDGPQGIFWYSLVYGFDSYPVSLEDVADHLLSETNNGKRGYGGYFDMDLEDVKYFDEGCWAESEKMIIGLQKIIKTIKGKRNNELLSYLITTDISIDIYYADDDDDVRNTDLLYAVKNNSIEAIKKLVNNGADINFDDNDGYTALDNAIMNNCIEAVKILFDSCTDPIYSLRYLFLAINEEVFEIAGYLLESGVDINCPDDDGDTVLIEICNGWSPSRDQVKYLLEAGADINHKNNDGNTALIFAINEEDYEIAKYLIESGADINLTDIDRCAALQSAAYGSIEVVKYLVETGADINHKDNNSETALFYAVTGHSIEMVKYLVEAGTDINHKNNDGKNILVYAKELDDSDEEIIDYLKDLFEDN
jgi:ankyrin repeat protein